MRMKLHFISGPCWRQIRNKGGYPRDSLIVKKSVNSEDQCLDICEEDSSCKAALLSPTKECHIVSCDENEITMLDGWKAGIKYKCPG